VTRRVLLIAWTAYPLNSSGAHRPDKFAKYLPEFGWSPVVLCPEWTEANGGGEYDPELAAKAEAYRTVRVPRMVRPSGVARRGPGRAAQFLWPYCWPLLFTRRILAEAERLVAEEQVDVVWSTYPPGPMHYVAGRVTRRHGIPWVADFRDLPDQDRDTRLSRRLVREEMRACRSARALTATTDWQRERLAGRHAAPVYTISNGFDPTDFSAGERPETDAFTIRYFGTLYNYRDPRPLFEALDRLVGAGEVDLDDVRVEFYGTPPQKIRTLVQGYHCRGVVRPCERVTHGEMVRLQARTHVLLLLKAPEAGGSIPAMLFDYLGARRPILNIPGDGNLVDGILKETGAGISAATPADIAGWLAKWYREFKASGTVPYSGRDEAIARYTRREGARKLAGLLDSVVCTRDKPIRSRENTGHTSPEAPKWFERR